MWAITSVEKRELEAYQAFWDDNRVRNDEALHLAWLTPMEQHKRTRQQTNRDYRRKRGLP